MFNMLLLILVVSFHAYPQINPINTSLSTNKSAYELGENIIISVKLKNITQQPITLGQFPTVTYKIGNWVFTPSTIGIPISITIPPGGSISKDYTHLSDSFLVPMGIHNVEAIVHFSAPYYPIQTNSVSISITSLIPVELISFNAISKNGLVELQWVTATETNNQGFIVERTSCYHIEWIQIGYIAGAGTDFGENRYIYIDKEIIKSSNYFYRLKQIDYDGSYQYSSIISTEADFSNNGFELFQNYPNPFNPLTRISYNIPVSAIVNLRVFDILGNEVAILINERKEPGNYEVTFEAGNLSNGVYFYELKADDFKVVKKLILMK